MLRLLFRLPLALAVALCAACGSTPTEQRLLGIVSPYKIDIVQGNVVTREQLALVKVGTPSAVVRNILGTPLLTSIFHNQRWDYVFSLKRQGAVQQSRRVTLFFKADLVESIEADDLPSEAEFVATLKSGAQSGGLPALEAPPEKLAQFPVPQRSTEPAKPSAAAKSTVYPPLGSSD